MAQHERFFPTESDSVVPAFATYDFPDHANKALKMTTRVTPVSGTVFGPGDEIEFRIPSQGYIVPGSALLCMDLILVGYSTPSQSIVRLQNTISSVFSRARWTYGSMTPEDITKYNLIFRNITEWTGTSQMGSLDQTTINEGVGGCVVGAYGDGTGPASTVAGSLVNTRNAYIQGIDNTTTTGFGNVPNLVTNTTSGLTGPTKRYTMALGLGIFVQGKLIPAKWMSGFNIYFSCASEVSCIYAQAHGASGTTPTYRLSNVVLLLDVLEFDASFDAVFLQGLQTSGVPLKWSSFHSYTYSISGQQNINISIPEKSRSIKSVFAVQRRAPENLYTDSHAGVFTSSAGTLTSFQWKAGNRMYPSQPIPCSITVSSSISNGAAEAFSELQKALNIQNQYSLETAVNVLRWAVPYVTATFDGTNAIALGESDYGAFTRTWGAGTGVPVVQVVAAPASGNVGSCCFAMAVDFETSNGLEISGLNGEEQSDITLLATYSATQASGYVMDVFVQYDAVFILKENSVATLIT